MINKFRNISNTIKLFKLNNTFIKSFGSAAPSKYQEPTKTYSLAESKHQQDLGQNDFHTPYQQDVGKVKNIIGGIIKNHDKVYGNSKRMEMADKMESHFLNDLGMTEMDMFEVMFQIELMAGLEFGDDDFEAIETVGDLVETFSRQPLADFFDDH